MYEVPYLAAGAGPHADARGMHSQVDELPQSHGVIDGSHLAGVGQGMDRGNPRRARTWDSSSVSTYPATALLCPKQARKGGASYWI